MSETISSVIETTRPRPGTGGERMRVIQGPEILERYAAYLVDESRFGEPRADKLYFPASEEHLAEILTEANARGEPVTISAGRTGIVGGAVPPGGILVSLERMNPFLGISRDGGSRWLLAAGPGTSLARLYELIGEDNRANPDRRRLFYPPDPTETTAHLGGTVATNASGARTLRYGPTRAYVERLRIVLSNGEVVDMKRGKTHSSEDGSFRIRLAGGGELAVPIPDLALPAVKSSAGYFCQRGMDIIDLFIGSEGTLAVISEVAVRLIEEPPGILSSVSFFPSEKLAVRFVRQLRGDFAPGRADRLEPEAIEYFDKNSLDLLRKRRNAEGAGSEMPELPAEAVSAVFFEHAYDENSLEELSGKLERLLSSCGSSMESSWGGLGQGDLTRMTALRHGLPETVNSIIAERKTRESAIHKMSTDLAVPDEHLESILAFYRENLEKSGLEYVIFGHIGNNHLHVNILPKDRDELARARYLQLEFAREAVRLGGTVAAEHGIGKIKHALLKEMLGDKGIQAMSAVKHALDPKWILSPGNIFPVP